MDVIITLRWQSRSASHIDSHRFGGIGQGLDEIRRLAETAARSERLATEVRDTSLYGWKHTPPRLGRHYPRGLLNEFPHSDLRPFRVLGIGDKRITADFNAPLAGIAPTVTVTPAGDSAGTQDITPLLAAWLANGPGMQAPPADGDTDFIAGEPFARADAAPDAVFYAHERLVDHLDDNTRAEITARYRQWLQPGMKVLDLMASWNSHLPADLPLTVTGLGMNESELGHNPRLAERVVHDLNRQPALPFADAGFDAALCALSIEYLVDPVAVVREVGRVLKPGAPFIISFSDRWFPPKAIRLWSELHPFERIAFVADLLRHSGRFENIETESLLGLPAPLGNWRPKGRPHADPLFVVCGRCRPA
jgi:SAM-dependent methyltransferase